MAGKSWTAALRGEGAVEDVISSLPDVILQHILTFIPTKFAIRTSLLSKRWRHVWCDIPSLYFVDYICDRDDESIYETLSNYHTAPKIINFHKRTSSKLHVDKWIKFAISRNVENLSLEVDQCGNLPIPDFFFINSSVKQLTFELCFADLTPKNSVLWTSLKKLYLGCCKVSDESIAKILSGCPVLESLTLYFCDKLMVLDLRDSLRLTTLEIRRNIWVPGPTQILAPHLHSLTLRNSLLPCTLVDVSSLTEAKMEIGFNHAQRTVNAEFLQVMVLKMLEKIQNAEKLTLGGNFLQILSLAELCGVPFPMLKVKYLTLETVIFQYVIPGIERLLQNSPCLKKLTLRAWDSNTLPGFDGYLTTQGLNPDQCWKSKDGVFWNENRWDVELKHVTSFVELVLKNAKTLEQMVLLLSEH
ncbi:PREDICTED: putative F-box/LRR-repeat protein At3g18150 [Camelina sativa]|uniref:F-box/LRR-repeat protein At3g18150 n=1 Tax=Camelina sativa TaxID=90675 RepID=A0ABM0YJA8_CAMSA|nr:PREDICTED: putative F-box/LRR-repeat protein At3g18150 [Camelina sativa]